MWIGFGLVAKILLNLTDQIISISRFKYNIPVVYLLSKFRFIYLFVDRLLTYSLMAQNLTDFQTLCIS